MKIHLTSQIEEKFLHLIVTYLIDHDREEIIQLRRPAPQIAPGRFFIRASVDSVLLKPLEFSIVSPKAKPTAVTLGAHGGSHSISIKCSLESRLFRIQEDGYLLDPEKSYEIFVHHDGTTSNTVTVSLADFAAGH